MSEPVHQQPELMVDQQPEPVRRLWPTRLLVAAAIVSPLPATVLARLAPEWGEAVQAGFTPGPMLLALAFADWTRLRR
ncbi:hypothetical protein ACIBEA_43945 [Streptomyces sp. NPDC051555]|uniref:hypothetical protein n=1 Tax=Streptomyces sp. NPDC051555 TaxID=3365657 RepID=UPI0037A7F2DA